MVHSEPKGPRTYYLVTHLFPQQACEPFRGSDNVLLHFIPFKYTHTKKAFSEHFLNVYEILKLKKKRQCQDNRFPQSYTATAEFRFHSVTYREETP